MSLQELERKPRGHAGIWRRTLVPASFALETATLSADNIVAHATRRAVAAIWPWRRNEYPGRLPLLHELLRGYTRRSILSWISGQRTAPADALARLAAHARSRSVALGQIADELDSLAKGRPARQKPAGWEVVKDRGGVVKDGRGRGGRPKTSL
jgi:hypothetical protein